MIVEFLCGNYSFTTIYDIKDKLLSRRAPVTLCSALAVTISYLPDSHDFGRGFDTGTAGKAHVPFNV